MTFGNEFVNNAGLLVWIQIINKNYFIFTISSALIYLSYLKNKFLKEILFIILFAYKNV